METTEFIRALPYAQPFLFVDSIDLVTEEEIMGSYRLREDEYFYEGHFPGNPVTPGVIILEIMAQIGLVCLGLYLNRHKVDTDSFVPLFSSTNVDFLAPAYPSHQLQIHSKKIYYRFNKLKCAVECRNLTTNEIVCRGEFSGMIVSKNG